MKESSANVTYIHQDHLTGTSVVSDSSGALVSSIKYTPFGSTRSGSVPTDKKFTGQRLDDTGLYYYGARFYDPNIGRFISADVIVQNPGNPQTLNRYSYVLNNPLRYVDPSGLEVDISWSDEYGSISLSDVISDPSSQDPDFFSSEAGQAMQGLATEWVAWSADNPAFAGFLEESVTLFSYKGGLPDDLFSSIPSSAMQVITGLAGRANAFETTLLGLALFAGKTGGCDLRTGSGGIMAFENINVNSATGQFMENSLTTIAFTFGYADLSP